MLDMSADIPGGGLAEVFQLHPHSDALVGFGVAGCFASPPNVFKIDIRSQFLPGIISSSFC